MAFCPNCKAEMDLKAVECEACGYDFPPSMSGREKTGVAYSWLADVALFVGCFVAGLCCIGSVISVFAKIFSGNYIEAFLISPIVFFLSLAMLVVFLRAADRGSNE